MAGEKLESVLFPQQSAGGIAAGHDDGAGRLAPKHHEFSSLEQALCSFPEVRFNLTEFAAPQEHIRPGVCLAIALQLEKTTAFVKNDELKNERGNRSMSVFPF